MLRGRYGRRKTRRWYVGEHASGGVGIGHCVTPEVKHNGRGDRMGILLFGNAVEGNIIVSCYVNVGLLAHLHAYLPAYLLAYSPATLLVSLLAYVLAHLHAYLLAYLLT